MQLIALFILAGRLVCFIKMFVLNNTINALMSWPMQLTSNSFRVVQVTSVPVMSSYVQLCPVMSSYVQSCTLNVTTVSIAWLQLLQFRLRACHQNIKISN